MPVNGSHLREGSRGSREDEYVGRLLHKAAGTRRPSHQQGTDLSQQAVLCCTDSATVATFPRSRATTASRVPPATATWPT
jgi:hypothetical protein